MDGQRSGADGWSDDKWQTWLNHTLPGEDHKLIITGEGSRLSTRFNPPLELDVKHHAGYEMALLRLETYYSFPNLDASNNRFRVSVNRGRTWIDVIIPMGCYDISAINDYLQRKMKDAGVTADDVARPPSPTSGPVRCSRARGKKDEKYISFAANPNTLKCVLELKHEDAQIDFSTQSSIRSVLGFTGDIYKDGPKRVESESIVNILSVNSILVNCDVIDSSRVNGSPAPVLYSFFPDVSPGDKIVSEPRHLIYSPLTLDVITCMQCWLTDQSHRLINLRGEQLTLTLHIRKKR